MSLRQRYCDISDAISEKEICDGQNKSNSDWYLGKRY